jgi:hypothetical protein
MEMTPMKHNYIVKTNSDSQESAFFGFMFRDALIERIAGDEETETYEVSSEHDLALAFDNAESVIEYTTTL